MYESMLFFLIIGFTGLVLFFISITLDGISFSLDDHNIYGKPSLIFRETRFLSFDILLFGLAGSLAIWLGANFLPAVLIGIAFSFAVIVLVTQLIRRQDHRRAHMQSKFKLIKTENPLKF